MSNFILLHNVQPNATYPKAKRSAAKIALGAEAVAMLINVPPKDNALPKDNVIFGKSATQIFRNVAKAMRSKMMATDQIVVMPEHESE